MDELTKPRKMSKEERAVNNNKLNELDKQIAKTIKELPKSKPKDNTNSTRKMMEEIKKNYPLQKNGKVIFDFPRLFFVIEK